MNIIETLVLTLKVVGYLSLAFEALLVVGMIYLAVDYVKTNFGGEEPTAKHRAPSENFVEKVKRELREEKARQARDDNFFKEGYYMPTWDADTGAWMQYGEKLSTSETKALLRLMGAQSDTMTMKVFTEEI